MARLTWVGVFVVMMCVLVGAKPAAAQTVLLTDASQITSPGLIDFNTGPVVSDGTGPAQIGTPVGRNITWEASANGYLGYNSGFGLVNNGSWEDSKTRHTALNSYTGSMTFRFVDGPVRAVGGFVNYLQNGTNSGDDPIIEALGAGDVVLASYNLATDAPISTPGQENGGAFRGIARASADIHAFRLRNDKFVLDDLRFTNEMASAVPEPGAALLFLPAVSVVLLIRRRRRSC